MEQINEQLMTSLNTTLRSLRSQSYRESLYRAGISQAPQRGILMDRRKMMQIKEQYAALLHDGIIRELAAIAMQEGSTTPVSERRLMSYFSGSTTESMNNAVAKLEREGYIKRIRRSGALLKHDLLLTEEGWQYAARLKEIKDRQNEEFLKPLTEEEKDTLIQLLKKLNVADELGFQN